MPFARSPNIVKRSIARRRNLGPVASLKRFLHDAGVIGRMSDPVVNTERLRGVKTTPKRR